MDIEYLREYCLAKAGTTESFPFDESTLVFKVMNKMFALSNLEREPLAINLKCDPEYAIELRDTYAEVQPGYHMNKKHWNTVTIEGELEQKMILSLIDHSYELVVKSLPKAKREELKLASDD